MVDLSIIVPIYNTDIFVLKRCINSILDNNSLDYEIILIDDGSNDSNSKLYKDLACKNIKYFKQKNMGVSTARNLGIKKSTGKYITFVDSDDIIYADVLSKKIIKKNYDIIHYDSNFIVKDKIIYSKGLTCLSGNVEKIDVVRDFLEKGLFHSPWSKLIKKSFLIENNLLFYTDMIQSEDAIFNLDMLDKNPYIFYIDKPMYGYYFDFCTSSSRWEKHPDIMFDNFLKLFDRKFELIDKYNLGINTVKNVSDIFISNLFSLCLDKCHNNIILKKSKSILLNNTFNLKLTNFSKLKYFIITINSSFLFYILSKFRYVYIKVLKKGY